MRRLLAVGSAALALTGCAESAPPALNAVKLTTGPTWQALAPGVAGTQLAKAENPCRVGTDTCIADVKAEMQARLDQLAAACDHRAPFALMYLRVTAGVEQTGKRDFDNPGYLNHLDAVFARLYFNATDAYQAGNLRAVPAAWRIAFDAAHGRQVTALGDMLLGMNAHISRDLPFALQQAGMTTSTGASGRPDFDRVNALLSAVTNDMLGEEAQRFDPSVKDVTLGALNTNARDVGSLIAGWRTEAWNNAERLAAAKTPAEQALVAADVEQAAAQRARLIAAVFSYTLTGGRTASRDHYCLSELHR